MLDFSTRVTQAQCGYSVDAQVRIPQPYAPPEYYEVAVAAQAPIIVVDPLALS